MFCEADIAADCPLEMEEGETLEDIYHDSCAWFGIKQIDSPFDSSDRLFMVDMYGGGAASVVQVYADMDVNDLFADIRYAFRNCINSCGYSIDDDENILLEWV